MPTRSLNWHSKKLSEFELFEFVFAISERRRITKELASKAETAKREERSGLSGHARKAGPGAHDREPQVMGKPAIASSKSRTSWRTDDSQEHVADDEVSRR